MDLSDPRLELALATAVNGLPPVAALNLRGAVEKHDRLRDVPVQRLISALMNRPMNVKGLEKMLERSELDVDQTTGRHYFHTYCFDTKMRFLTLEVRPGVFEEAETTITRKLKPPLESNDILQYAYRAFPNMLKISTRDLGAITHLIAQCQEVLIKEGIQGVPVDLCLFVIDAAEDWNGANDDSLTSLLDIGNFLQEGYERYLRKRALVAPELSR
jgi:hypothetical protein